MAAGLIAAGCAVFADRIKAAAASPDPAAAFAIAIADPAHAGPPGGDRPAGDAVKAVEASARDEARARATLESVREILSRGCATSLSHELRRDASRRGELREKAAEARRLLEQAAPIVEQVKDEAAREALELLLDRWRAFVEVFAALGALGEDEASRRAAISACGELASQFDIEDAGIVESARLWQGIVYRRAGRADRALQVLRPAITRPASPAIGLWSRLERARALGDENLHVAGIALCMRIESRIGRWFRGDEPSAAAATRTVRLVRAELLNGWSARLAEQGSKDAAQAARAQARQIAEEMLRVNEAARWLPVTEAIATQPPQPSTQPQDADPSDLEPGDDGDPIDGPVDGDDEHDDAPIDEPDDEADSDDEEEAGDG